MGLLDDAIREHLELKRRSGADPGAIAREEREALAPVFPEEAPDEGGAVAVEKEPEVAPAFPANVVPARQPPPGDERVEEFSWVGQETAELDMQAVMEEDPEAADSASPVGPVEVGPAAAYSGGLLADDSDGDLADGGAGEAVPEDVPGQERLTFE
ncbi:MAG TPA: hypothetical protein VK790_03485 [Solirubrobacteraceae bacterium]|jgi:hypothetical protein|nr:hypothetical protein [Solirubrobacteraceae bacterium]